MYIFVSKGYEVTFFVGEEHAHDFKTIKELSAMELDYHHWF
mgnify:CR=1 FL=1